jgi:hypothetical protein
MSARLARLTLRLYPLAFQRRYGGEMRALVEQSPPGWAGVLDLVRGALVAHLRPPQAAAACVDPADRVRASTGGVLVCWVVFAASGFAFYKTTEDAPFSAAGHAHPLLGAVHVTVQAIAVMASAAVVLGALPLIVATLVHARREHTSRLVVRPIEPLVLFAFLTAILIIVADGQPGRRPGGITVGYIAFTAWGLIGLACGLVCAVRCREALFAIRAPRRDLLVALGSATFVSFAMAAIAAATAVYAITLAVDASRLSAGSAGPFQVLSTGAALIVQVVVMVAAGGLAVTATRRGWRMAGGLADA